MTVAEVDVLIVGGGPVGLLTGIPIICTSANFCRIFSCAVRSQECPYPGTISKIHPSCLWEGNHILATLNRVIGSIGFIYNINANGIRMSTERHIR